jgi:hypothetical protein
MSSTDDGWDAAAEEKWWRGELEMMGYGADAIEQEAGLNTSGFYVACIGGLDAAFQFTATKYFVSRAEFVAELRRLVTEPTAPSRPVPSVAEYQRAQRCWLEDIIRKYDPIS